MSNPDAEENEPGIPLPFLEDGSLHPEYMDPDAPTCPPGSCEDCRLDPCINPKRLRREIGESP